MSSSLLFAINKQTGEQVALRANQDGALQAGNFGAKLREAFQSMPLSQWDVDLATGDIVTVDGNAGGASYLVISKSPLLTGTRTTVQSKTAYEMPVEVAAGIHMSQRTLGQQFAFEVVSTETAITAPADVAISSISQATTTLTVNTATAHGLRPGQRISIYGCADSRMNYPALVVATTPSTTQFTVTAGPGGAIPSVTAGPFTSGFVAVRPALGFARNGTSMVFDNPTVTQASFYARSEAGDSVPIGGTISGNHSATVATTASVQAIAAALTYSFRPTSEYRLALMADRLQWQDNTVDAVAQATARATFSQVVPNPDMDYRIRFRAENAPSFTVPNAQIVTAVKTGTTTATVTTDVPHGLTVTDVVNIFGARDQTNFANLSTATAVASIVSPTQFTIVWGSAVTATTFGGFVARVQGGQNMQGTTAQAAQSVTASGGILNIVGSAAWSGISIGDYVNVVGMRDNTVGNTLGLDGSYRVRDIQTTSLFLEPVGTTATPADLASTNCGGSIIRRTCLRVSFLRVFDFDRLRVEAISRPINDLVGGFPITVQGTPAFTLSSGTVTTVTTLTGGAAAEDAATTSNPLIVGGMVRTAVAPTTLIAGDACRVTFTSGAAMVVKGFSVPEADWTFTGVLTAASAVAARAAGATGIRNYVTGLQYQNTSATATTVLVQDGATTIAQFNAPASMATPGVAYFATPLRGTAATALNVNCGTAGANVLINVQGYQAP